jgi:hypothetical protein
MAIDNSGEAKETSEKGYRFIEQQTPMGEPMFKSHKRT